MRAPLEAGLQVVIDSLAAGRQISVVPPLLVRPFQRDGESQMGFLIRTSDANGLRSGAKLFAAVGFRFFGRVRICPACSKEPDGIWPVAWEDWLRPWCRHHRVWLVDECAVCASRFSASQMSFRACQCKASLSEQPMASVSKLVLDLDLDDDGIVESVFWLGALLLHGLAGKPGKLESRRSAADVRSVIEAGAGAMVDWPLSFLRAMTANRTPSSDGRPGAQLIADAYPGLQRALRRAPAHLRASVASALDSMVRKERETGLPLIGKNHFIGNKASTIHQSAKELGVGFGRLRRALSVECCDIGARRITPNGRLRAVFNADELAILRERLHDAIGMKAAARELGVKVDRVSELCRASLLRRADDGRVSRAELGRLRDHLLNGATLLDGTEDGFVGLNEVFKRWVVVRHTAELINDIGSGRLEKRYVSRDEHGLRTLRLRASEVVAWARHRSRSVAQMGASQREQKLRTVSVS